MIGIYLVGAVGAAVGEMDAEVTVEVVVLDGAFAVGHAVDACRIALAVNCYPDRAARPGAVISAASLLHSGGRQLP